MKNFEEKEVKDLSIVNGGKKIGGEVSVTVTWDGWFDGSLNLFDGIKGNTVVNELDVKATASFNF